MSEDITKLPPGTTYYTTTPDGTALLMIGKTFADGYFGFSTVPMLGLTDAESWGKFLAGRRVREWGSELVMGGEFFSKAARSMRPIKGEHRNLPGYTDAEGALMISGHSPWPG